MKLDCLITRYLINSFEYTDELTASDPTAVADQCEVLSSIRKRADRWHSQCGSDKERNYFGGGAKKTLL
jgi:hypothetical protein